MHVALAADGRCVAELLGDAFDRGDDVALRLGLAVVLLEFGKRQTPPERFPPKSENPWR